MNLDQFKKNGKFLMLALDHRGSFRKLINLNNPNQVTGQEVVELKTEIISSLKDQFSGLLIDIEIPKQVRDDIWSKKPFLLPIEKSGFVDDKAGRVNELEYTAQQLKDLGASGVKLLIYFNPGDENSHLQLATADHVLKECKEAGIPLFLEIVTYGNEDSQMVQSLKRFLDASIIPDVFKLEYPGSLENCQKITQQLGQTPWIILTRGDTYEVFKKELEQAARAGCQGFLAGRALWQEVCQLEGEEKQKFLSEILPNRFKEISQIVMNR